MILNIDIEVEIDKTGTVKDLVNEALEMYNHEEFDIKRDDFNSFEHIQVTQDDDMCSLEAKLDTLKEDTTVDICK